MICAYCEQKQNALPFALGSGIAERRFCSAPCRDLWEERDRKCAVDAPPHYNAGDIECIDAIGAALGHLMPGFLAGNAIKYIWRYRHKNGREDLRKAMWYLKRLEEWGE